MGMNNWISTIRMRSHAAKLVGSSSAARSTLPTLDNGRFSFFSAASAIHLLFPDARAFGPPLEYDAPRGSLFHVHHRENLHTYVIVQHSDFPLVMTFSSQLWPICSPTGKSSMNNEMENTASAIRYSKVFCIRSLERSY